MEKVVVTGMGAITSIGNNTEEFFNGLINGKNGVKHITRIPVDSYDVVLAAEVDDEFETLVKKYIPKRLLNNTTKAIRMSLAATGEAIDQSGIDFSGIDTARVAVIFGVNGNSNFPDLENTRNLIFKETPNTVASIITIKYGLHGTSFSLSAACSSSGYAMSLASHLIQTGVYDVVITGGISSLVSDKMITSFTQLMAMSVNSDTQKASRPFSKERDGFVLGEGAGSVILESESFAKKRGANIICSFAGSAMYSECESLTAPEENGKGMIKVMKMALENAGMTPDEIDYVNAHGTSTGLNDKYETMAVKEVFGKRAYDVPVSSVKSAIGHTFAGGSALEAIASIKALQTGMIPPTINYDVPDPELDLDYVPNVSRKADLNAVMTNSYAFGGQNVSMIFRKYTD